MPDAASTFATQVDIYYYFLIAVTLFFTFAISAALIFLASKYRRRSQLDRPQEVHGNNMLEITWTIIPLILSLVMFFWGAHLYFIYAKSPSDAMEILVTGKQWMWKIQHPNGNREINELHVPLGQPIKLTMTSEDVIHSFFIPAFRIKTDVVPGRYTATWFTPTKTGKYHLFCAEYCGTKHSEMTGSVYVVHPADYETWLSGGGKKESPIDTGKRLFTELGCVTCHHPNSGARGPDLTDIFQHKQLLQNGKEILVDENYLRESILNPQKQIVLGYQPIMPTFKGIVSETQLMQMIAYIKAISQKPEIKDQESDISNLKIEDNQKLPLPLGEDKR